MKFKLKLKLLKGFQKKYMDKISHFLFQEKTYLSNVLSLFWINGGLKCNKKSWMSWH